VLDTNEHTNCCTGDWDLPSHQVMCLGTTPLQPIRCCLAKGGRLWVGYWNRVHVVDIGSRKVEVRDWTRVTDSRSAVVNVLVKRRCALVSPRSKPSRFPSAANSRCASCVQQEVACGLPAGWIPFSGCLIGPVDGRCRRSTWLLWSLKH